MSAVPVVSRRPSDGHPNFLQPANRNAEVWRYFTIPRLFELLKNRRLQMSRSDKLRDPCEGSRPKGDAQIYAAAARTIIAEGRGVQLADIRGSWQHLDETVKTRIFVSCWTMAEHDDMGMWERYCNPKEIGVAIQSTYARLDASLPFSDLGGRPVMLSLVRYGDYQSPDFFSDPSNVYSTYVLKKIQYRNEHEVRVLCDMFKCEAPRITVQVDVDMLVEQLVFSPYMKPVLFRGVEKAVRDMGYRFPISHSSAFEVSKAY